VTPYGRRAPTSAACSSASRESGRRWPGGNLRAARHVLLVAVRPLSRRTRTLGKRQPEGPPPAPAVQRIRLRYTKRGRLRFTSHRDFQRAFERALRRAEVPMAYSAGFTPHPKVSYANAAPTGTGSEAEYLEIALTEARDPDKLRELLDESLPTGLDVVDAVEARTSGLADRLTASVWELRLDGVDPVDARRAVEAFNTAETVEVQRMTKNGVRTFDARPAVASLQSTEKHRTQPATGLGSDGAASVAHHDGPTGRPCAILRLVVRHVTPAVRPDDVLSGLRAVADLAPPVPAAVTRLAQGLLDEETGTVTDPLAPDREAAEALSKAEPTAAATAPA
jgi:radical SAM-linked protein